MGRKLHTDKVVESILQDIELLPSSNTTFDSAKRVATQRLIQCGIPLESQMAEEVFTKLLSEYDFNQTDHLLTLPLPSPASPHLSMGLGSTTGQNLSPHIRRQDSEPVTEQQRESSLSPQYTSTDHESHHYDNRGYKRKNRQGCHSSRNVRYSVLSVSPMEENISLYNSLASSANDFQKHDNRAVTPTTKQFQFPMSFPETTHSEWNYEQNEFTNRRRMVSDSSSAQLLNTRTMNRLNETNGHSSRITTCNAIVRGFPMTDFQVMKSPNQPPRLSRANSSVSKPMNNPEVDNDNAEDDSVVLAVGDQRFDRMRQISTNRWTRRLFRIFVHGCWLSRVQRLGLLRIYFRALRYGAQKQSMLAQRLLQMTAVTTLKTIKNCFGRWVVADDTSKQHRSASYRVGELHRLHSIRPCYAIWKLHANLQKRLFEASHKTVHRYNVMLVTRSWVLWRKRSLILQGLYKTATECDMAAVVSKTFRLWIIQCQHATQLRFYSTLHRKKWSARMFVIMVS